jgi:hypothetical protein
MVLVDGATYRIVRTARTQYDIVRIADDQLVGTFVSAPKLEVTLAIEGVDPGTVKEIARTAVRGAKTSWVGRLEL